tara:strand:+ start:485 stop:691 length:207 start_codon:yes stop_codon:yes gene_type:complete
MKQSERFTIIDKVDSNGIVAVREKPSVEINEETKEVKMHDFIYTFDEIIAVGNKLQAISASNKKLTFS